MTILTHPFDDVAEDHALTPDTDEQRPARRDRSPIVGESAALLAVLRQADQVAVTDSTVLILGETGTGKELLAHHMHRMGNRSAEPFVATNIAAIPATLLESELFGRERGAYTGAMNRQIGRFELAHGGTLFLDEIGEMPLDVQAKLLRVLQEREFERVGSGTPIKCDVRIIAATNRDLLKSVKEKTFREDLYYRLNVFPLHLPALRERKDDIPLLIEFLARRAMHRIGKKLDSISADTLQRLVEYPWPGNIRELENIVERAVILSNGPQLEVGHEILPEQSPDPARSAAADATSLEAVERDHRLQMLMKSEWVIEGANGAAAKLNLHPNTLRGRMKKLGLVRPTM